ncbi:MAG TPA: hypothetical protein VFZ59_10300 [Verrucomicrobiae bacterium]|nr:hypothetical protein [Verrucomicrobiae bacterium]
MIIRTTFPQVYRFDHPKAGIYYQVSARSKKWGLNERKTFNTEKDALSYARQIEKHVQDNGRRTEIPKDKLVHVTAYEKLIERLQPFGKNPEDAVEHYVKFLGDSIIRQAMPTVRELVEQWHAHKLLDTTLDSQYRNEIKLHCKFIKCKWGDYRADEVRKNDIDVVLKKHPCSNNTRKKYLTMIRMFFNWVLGLDKGYVTTNPAEGIKFKADRFEKEFYQPARIHDFFRKVAEKYPQLVGYYALLTFAGLRPSEGARVQWRHVNFTTNELHVITGKTDARHIPMQPVLVAWLKWHKEHSEKDAALVPDKNMFNLEKDARGLMDGGWIADGLRHTFATNFASLEKNYSTVAWYMGNSVAMIKKHYAQTIPSEPLNEFWNMIPDKVLS